MTDWDLLWKTEPEAFHQFPENELVRWASALAPGSKVLEVGCGNGANLYALKRLGMECWGIDLAREALLASPSLWHGTEVAIGSATELQFPSFSFDAVADVQCLQHLASDDLPKAYSEIARVLKVGGRFFSMHLTYGDTRYPKLRFCRPSIRALEDAGFVVGFVPWVRRCDERGVVEHVLYRAVKP